MAVNLLHIPLIIYYIYSPAKKSWPPLGPPCNFRPSTRRYVDPPLILKSLTQTLSKNKRVLSRGWFSGSRCGLKHARFDRPFFGLNDEDLLDRISQNCLYIFSCPTHALKPPLICLLVRLSHHILLPFKNKRVSSRGLFTTKSAK